MGRSQHPHWARLAPGRERSTGPAVGIERDNATRFKAFKYGGEMRGTKYA